jgi:hypothetical protein
MFTSPSKLAVKTEFNSFICEKMEQLNKIDDFIKKNAQEKIKRIAIIRIKF